MRFLVRLGHKGNSRGIAGSYRGSKLLNPQGDQTKIIFNAGDCH